MDKSKQLIIGIAVFVVGVGGLWFIDSKQDSTQTDSSDDTSQQASIQTDIVFSDDGKTVMYEGQSGQTALALLEAGTTVETEDSDFGEFVVGINGVEADSSSQYWSFYIDGNYAPEGAGTYVTSEGEQIKWQLEDL